MCKAHWEIKKTKTVGRGPVNIILLLYYPIRQYYNMVIFDTIHIQLYNGTYDNAYKMFSRRQ